MKQWTRTLLVGIAGLSLAFAACGDDGTTDNDTSTTDTVTADTGMEDTGGTDTMQAATNQCTGTDDLARIQDTSKPDPSGIASDCGTKVCISYVLNSPPDYEGAQTCANDCMKNGNTDQSIEPAGLTDGCTSCYVNAVLCAAQYCLTPCLSPESQACVDCRGGDNDDQVDCTGNFYTCSGLPQE